MTLASVFHRTGFRTRLLLVSCLILSVTTETMAGEFHVSPNGRQDALGTEASPWDLAAALSGEKAVPPGSTIWLHAGMYRHTDRSPNSSFNVGSLSGSADQPIQVRAVPGNRVTIDGGLSIVRNVSRQMSPRHVWYRDLEITVSEKQRTSSQPGSSLNDIQAPSGGLNVFESDDCRFINLVIHDHPGNGIGLWGAARNTETYGCIVYGNGWSCSPAFCSASRPQLYLRNQQKGACVIHGNRRAGCVTAPARTVFWQDRKMM